MATDLDFSKQLDRLSRQCEALRDKQDQRDRIKRSELELKERGLLSILIPQFGCSLLPYSQDS